LSKESARNILEQLVLQKCGMENCCGNHTLIPTSHDVILVNCGQGLMFYRIECGKGVIKRANLNDEEETT
jgi:hypothetical protein